MDVDELFYGILRAINHQWVQSISFVKTERASVINKRDESLQWEVRSLKNDVEELQNTIMALQQKIGSSGDNCNDLENPGSSRTLIGGTI